VSVSQEQVLAALRAVQDPDLHKDIVTLGFVKDVKVAGGEVDFTIELTTPACPVKDEMKAEAEGIVRRLPGVTAARATMTADVKAAAASAARPCPASATSSRWGRGRAAWASPRPR